MPKLKTKWTLDHSQDLKSIHNIHAAALWSYIKKDLLERLADPECDPEKFSYEDKKCLEIFLNE